MSTPHFTAMPLPGAIDEDRRRVRRGLWLGLLGVTIFAMTLPATRIAVGTPEAPQLSGFFVAVGRAAVAGLLAAGYLLWLRAQGALQMPTRANLPDFALAALGVVFSFPILTSVALRHVEAIHAAVMIGILPLATAVLGAWLARQRPSIGFWACGVLGAALVVIYPILRSGGAFTLHWADLFLLAAAVLGAMGYVFGARLSARMPPAQVICWILVLSLPLTLSLALWSHPTQAIGAVAWLGFAYVAVFSQWLGFFPWYAGLALGGAVRVSQVQLVQPFLSMLFAVPLLGERLDGVTLAFCIAVVVVVFVGKRMPVHARSTE
ncbi:MAG: hypothetical protein RLZZ126_2008 [Pseudomonadota bacterium]|jgi:drug/metabolite transporter (DMT)-like permease